MANKDWETFKSSTREELALHILEVMESLDSTQVARFKLGNKPGFIFEIYKKSE